jgi:N6-adenosine-specific RNA methylase IME4
MDLDAIRDLRSNIPFDYDHCVLYLWATAPKLKEALDVMDSWGFKYKTHAIWDKEIIGMGYWFRGRHELLLVGTMGKVSPPEPKERVASVYKEKRGKHSSKPKYFRDIITDSFPADWNRLEMFAREKTSPSWDVWGNEVESDIKLI